jgi:hypothetical protein
MKNPLPTRAVALTGWAMAALLAGAAMAGDGAPATGSAKDGARGIMRADTDGDGRISKAEIAALQSQKQGEWFDKADADKDGFLTEEEIRQARDARRDHRRGEMKARMDEHFKQADVNGDGQLSLDEVQAKMPKLAERFTTLDADKNGALSKEELKRGGWRHSHPQG